MFGYRAFAKFANALFIHSFLVVLLVNNRFIAIELAPFSWLLAFVPGGFEI